MKLFVVLAALLAGCLAQKPHPCKSPPLLSGGLYVTTQNERAFVLAGYLYDALGERFRIYETGTLDNQTFTYDYLLYYREQVVYQIDDKGQTCTKSPLKADFPFLGIPGDASFVAQTVLGDSSRPGEGLLVNTWTGNAAKQEERYMATVTEFGCIPVTIAEQTKEYGWVTTSYFDNVIGITNPDLLNPPSFCPDADTKTDEEPLDFFKILFRKN
ncbi:ependymin-like [Notolabrus celidotus]|uniref:ependymin-like n=1 Tax=Notolabrus celidotus TaxID=1203425 RepID=UPI00148F6E51|nr:ependymin-like [Notolabrus celidotus]